jgi:hypothetical protein
MVSKVKLGVLTRLWKASQLVSGVRYSGNELRPLVRRAKVSFFSGCNSRPATVAPAGSNRSGGGGNETAEAFDAKGRVGGSASRQAVTYVNAEQASKQLMWEPTR